MVRNLWTPHTFFSLSFNSLFFSVSTCLSHLTNQKRGDYYGRARTWPQSKNREMGVHLLNRALKIFLRVRSFGVIRIRINDPRSLGSWCIKGTNESTLITDSSVPLMHHDPSDLGSLIRIRITPKEHTLSEGERQMGKRQMRAEDLRMTQASWVNQAVSLFCAK